MIAGLPQSLVLLGWWSSIRRNSQQAPENFGISSLAPKGAPKDAIDEERQMAIPRPVVPTALHVGEVA